MFVTRYNDILEKLDQIDPIRYAKTRNYVDGSISYLSPYISRGVISTKFVIDRLMLKGYTFDNAEKYFQELAWRDYWQMIWKRNGDRIDRDFKSNQTEVKNYEIPNAIINAETGIEAIDQAINEFYKTGYIHNHVRMYIASLTCNIAKSHWHIPAKWMYYHLLDADWASNALSWQWVAGSNSNKKYIANQENINRYCRTNQKNTFLDVEYSKLIREVIPEPLNETAKISLEPYLPQETSINLIPDRPTMIYNFYNLDPIWNPVEKANKILLFEPSTFTKYPVSRKGIDFSLKLAENIDGIQIFVGEFEELKKQSDSNDFYYKEHPLNTHYEGVECPRDWIFNVEGDFNSFFSFWKKSLKQYKLSLS